MNQTEMASADDIENLAFPRPRLKRRWALELNERTLRAIAGCAQIQLTVREASACLGVSAPTFLDFLKRYPEAKHVWDDNKLIGKAKLRRILWRQAEKDPAQARFLAKDSRWLGMDDRRNRIAQAQAQVPGVTINLTVEDRIRRVVELQQKVINAQPLSLPAQAAKPGAN